MTHSVYSMSSSSRWMEGKCPASIRMSKPFPNTTNEAAEEGTAAHDMREFCLSVGVSPEKCRGMVFNGFTVDQEMIDGVSVDVNYVNRLAIEYGVKPLLEQRVTMSSLGRDDVFGTGDTLFLVPHLQLVHVIDFKYGRGPVQVENNSQLQGYGVASLDTFDMWDKVSTVKTTITQPRYHHAHGPIRTAEYSTEQMNNIGDKFYRSILAAEDPTVRPNAGEHCRYCKAAGNCRARMLRTIELAYRGEPIDELTSDEIEVILPEISAMTRHLEALQFEAVKRGQRGHRYDNYKIVESRPRAKCQDEKKLVADAKAQGFNVDRLYSKQLKSKSAIEKVLPGELISKHYVAPSSTDILVPMSDKRVAKVAGHVSKGTFGKVSK
ncbi:protein of unknown function DUF2800 [Vibrio phage 2.044.O._10N.261.51.B8]|nr:protein of unknown function DUF2800 [Vibrio phage 2.044.O._10N.261.51.B8]